jgi:hypothetical protein
MLGALSTLDSGMPVWWGLTVGSVIGVFFGMVFGGNRKWRVWDYIYGGTGPKGVQFNWILSAVLRHDAKAGQ